MATTVQTVPSSTSVTVQDSNNVLLTVTPAPQINLQVAPPPQQTIQIDRGVVGPQGPVGPAGPNTIGGYPINMSNVQPFDVVMFGAGAWNNVPQTEIADGGNF